MVDAETEDGNAGVSGGEGGHSNGKEEGGASEDRSSSGAAESADAASERAPSFPVFPVEPGSNSGAPLGDSSGSSVPAAAESTATDADPPDEAVPQQQSKGSRLGAFFSALRRGRRKGQHPLQQAQVLPSSDVADAAPGAADAQGASSQPEHATPSSSSRIEQVHAEQAGSTIQQDVGEGAAEPRSSRGNSSSAAARELARFLRGRSKQLPPSSIDWVELNASMMHSLHTVIVGIITAAIARVRVFPVW